MVAIAGVGGVAPVDPGAFIEAGAEVEAGVLVAAGKPQAALPALVAAGGQAQARLQPLLGAATGEDLDDAANRIAAIDRRARATQHLDSLDLVDVEKLQAAVTGGGVGDAYAVHQHQALRGLAASNVDTRHAAATARWRNLDAGYPCQQIVDAGGLQAVDVVTGEYRVGSTGLRAIFNLAVGADQGVGQLQGAVAVDRLGQKGRGQAQQKGEAKELHGSSKTIAGQARSYRFL
ncbi:hypothetical protein D3C77_374150 [compost metagenome]